MVIYRGSIYGGTLKKLMWRLKRFWLDSVLKTPQPDGEITAFLMVTEIDEKRFERRYYKRSDGAEVELDLRKHIKPGSRVRTCPFTVIKSFHDGKETFVPGIGCGVYFGNVEYPEVGDPMFLKHCENCAKPVWTEHAEFSFSTCLACGPVYKFA